MHVDALNTRGKNLTSAILSSTAVTNIGVLNCTYFGVRVLNMAAIFTMWRIKRLVFRITFTPAVAANDLLVFGVLDDSSGAEGDAPTSASGILALRTSGTIANTVGTVVREYKPANKNWMYTYAGQTNSDPRLTTYGVLYASQLVTGSSTVYVQADYSISFKGANDIGATVRGQTRLGPLELESAEDFINIPPSVHETGAQWLRGPIRSPSVGRVTTSASATAQPNKAL